jgi:hypothetical protein
VGTVRGRWGDGNGTGRGRERERMGRGKVRNFHCNALLMVRLDAKYLAQV